MSRMAKARELLTKENVEGLLILNPPNVRYLCDFTGTSGSLFLTHNRVLFIADFRYLRQAKSELPQDFEIIKEEGSLAKTLKPLLGGVKNLGIEGDYLSVVHCKELEKGLEVNITPIPQLISSLRKIKEEKELSKIRQAIRIACAAGEAIFKLLKSNLSEVEIARELEYELRKEGTDWFSFPSIVVSGERSTFPHGWASTKKMEEGDLVILDWGAIYQGYHCDLSRTVVIGSPSQGQKEIYKVVLEAQELGISLVRPGIVASELDRKVREFITKKGWGEFFGHSLGHGVGLEVHESPAISAKNSKLLLPGMVFTIEPGIYLPGVGGVRIEDMVLVTENGCEVLTRDLPKELKEVA